MFTIVTFRWQCVALYNLSLLRKHIFVCATQFKMYHFALVLCFALVNSQGDLCPNFCRCDGNIVLCRNLPQFPVFVTTALIRSIIIIDGTLTNLAITQTAFPKLESVVLRNCPFIVCQDLQQLAHDWAELIIESDLCIIGVTTRSSIETTSYTTDVTTSTYFASTQVASNQRTTAVSVYALSTVATSSEIISSNTAETTADLISSNTPDTTANLTVILASTLTVLVLVIILVIGICVYCVHKKISQDRVRAFSIDDDAYENRTHMNSIVNPSYNHYMESSA